jgi:hypothetical protein
MSTVEQDNVFLKYYAQAWNVTLSNAIDIASMLISTDIKLLGISYPKKYEYLKYVPETFILEKIFTPEAKIKINEVIDLNKRTSHIETHTLPDSTIRIYQIDKHPIVNPETNNVVAIWVKGDEVQANTARIITNSYVSKNNSNMEACLTEREKQVVFFLMINFNSEMIAEFISKIENKQISKNAIDQLFKNQLFPKFGVYNRKALSEKLLSIGFDRLIPYNILKENVSIDITDKPTIFL